MLTVTMTGDKIRSFTSPAVVVMPFREEIPNTAFINGSNRVFILKEEKSGLGTAQYISSIEMHKVKVNHDTTFVDYLYDPNTYIVVACDRTLRDNIRVKTAGEYDKILIKSKYRDVIAIQTIMEYDMEQMFENIKKTNPLILDIWYQRGTSSHPVTTIYVKSKLGCSQILENQINALFGNVESTNIINLELRYQKLEFVLGTYFCIIIMILFIYFLNKSKKCWRKLENAYCREKYSYYTKEIIRRNYKSIILTVIHVVALCFSYFIFIKFLPLPPIPSKFIPEKLIYIGELLDSVSESNTMLKKQCMVGTNLLNNLETTYRVLRIGLFALVGLVIFIFAILKKRKARYQAHVKKGNNDNE